MRTQPSIYPWLMRLGEFRFLSIVLIVLAMSLVSRTAMCQLARDEVSDDLQQLLGEIIEQEIPDVRRPEASGDDATRQPSDENQVRMAKVIKTIQSRLLQAAEGLAARETGDVTQNAQRDVVKMMQTVVQEMAAGANQRGDQQQATAAQESEDPSQPAEAREAGEEQPSDSEPLNSGGRASSEVRQGTDITVRAGPVEALGADVWGHLPEKTRGRLRAVRPADFLPQYRDAITEYYRRLSTSEEPQR